MRRSQLHEDRGEHPRQREQQVKGLRLETLAYKDQKGCTEGSPSAQSGGRSGQVSGHMALWHELG
jgi:hypothetical protein